MCNVNLLKGMRCPKCGNTQAFNIDTSCISRVTDYSIESRSEVEWNHDSYCECDSCHHEGVVSDFLADINTK